MTTIIPQCLYCKHFNEKEAQANKNNPSIPFFCDAFPGGDGIPREILLADSDHEKSYKGDHGIRFEEISGLLRR